MRYFVLYGVIMVSLFACSNYEKENSQSDEVVKFKEKDAFYDLLNLNDSNYQPLSAMEIVASSEFVGIGHIVEVKNGMKIRNKNSKIENDDMHTLVINMEVTRTIKGEAYSSENKQNVFLEYIHGGAFSAKTYNANLPKDEIMLFLKATKWPKSEDVEYIDIGSGHPSNSSLYGLTTPQGMIIEKDRAIFQPLETDANHLFPSAASLLEVENAIKTIMSELES